MTEIHHYTPEELFGLAALVGAKVIAFTGPDATDDEPTGAEAAFLIWSHEHGAWWKPGRWGYTGERDQAGRYTEEAARGICERAAYRWHRGAGGPDALPPEVMIPADAEDWQAAILTATTEFTKSRGTDSATPPEPTRIEAVVTLGKAEGR